MKSYQTVLPLLDGNNIEKISKPNALTREFYDRETQIVAKELLGKILIHETNEGICSGKIVETEAYLGQEDPACHAYAGYTKRTSLFFGKPGIAYIFVNYGLHYCLNAITLPPGKAGCVLIRALEPLEGIELMQHRRKTDDIQELTNGPGKLCAAFNIDKSCNGLDLVSSNLYIKVNVEKPVVCKSKRIGITKAADWLLRYFIKDNEFVSGSKTFNEEYIELPEGEL